MNAEQRNADESFYTNIRREVAKKKARLDAGRAANADLDRKHRLEVEATARFVESRNAIAAAAGVDVSKLNLVELVTLYS